MLFLEGKETETEMQGRGEGYYSPLLGKSHNTNVKKTLALVKWKLVEKVIISARYLLTKSRVVIKIFDDKPSQNKETRINR